MRGIGKKEVYYKPIRFRNEKKKETTRGKLYSFWTFEYIYSEENTVILGIAWTLN